MYYFYILLSDLDGKYYYGSTDNLQRRVNEHSKGKVSATRYRLPVKLIYYEAYQSLKLARQREHQVKNSGNARRTLKTRIN